MKELVHATVLSWSEDILVSRVGAEAVVLHERTGRYFGLNAVAAEVVLMAESGASIGDIVRSIESVFDAPVERIERDVVGCCDQLIALGILVRRSG